MAEQQGNRDQSDGAHHEETEQSGMTNKEKVKGISQEETTPDTSKSKILDRPTPSFSSLDPLPFSLDAIIQEQSGLINLEALQKLECETELITENLSRLLIYLRERTFEVTDTSTKCLDVLKSSLDDTCHAVNESIKMMYRLIAKCDEITKSLSIVDTYREEVRCLKKSLDLFENTVKLRSSQYPQIRISLQ